MEGEYSPLFYNPVSRVYSNFTFTEMRHLVLYKYFSVGTLTLLFFSWMLASFTSCAFVPFALIRRHSRLQKINHNSNSNINLQMVMRAWTCHGKTQKQLVDNLASAGIIKNPTIKKVMTSVDRANYVSAGYVANAYDDRPLPIGCGQTISAPHMHAHVLEELLPPLEERFRRNDPIKILDGSGYLTSCFGRFLEVLHIKDGTRKIIDSKVWGIEYVTQLLDISKENTNKFDKDLLENGLVDLQHGDGWRGLPDASPFHAIHVGAAAVTFPKNLMKQLAVGGVMIIPVGAQESVQVLYKVKRISSSTSSSFCEEDFKIEKLLNVRYVPLVRRDMKP